MTTARPLGGEIADRHPAIETTRDAATSADARWAGDHPAPRAGVRARTGEAARDDLPGAASATGEVLPDSGADPLAMRMNDRSHRFERSGGAPLGRPRAAAEDPPAVSTEPLAVLRRGRRLPLWRPLAARPFCLLWAGEAASLLADQAFFVALTWLVLELAGPGGALGLVLAVAAVPGVVLLPLGGWLSDRFGPAPLMAIAAVGRAGLMAGLAALVLLDAAALWHLYLLGGALSAVDAVYYPASLAIVPTLVDEEGLEPANALVQGAEQISGMVGPALAAGAVATVGLGATFGALALAFAAAAAAFGGVARAAGRSPRRTDADPAPPPSGGSSLLAGFRYAWGDPLIRTLLVVLAALSVATSGPILVGGAVLAETRFGGAGAFGILLSAFGAGSLLGVVGAGAAGRARRRGRSLLVVTAALGLGLAALAVVPDLGLAAAVAAGMGVGSGYLGVVLTAWLQERVAPEVRGRVMGLVVFAAVALDPVSYALTGALVEADARGVFLGAGGLLGLVVLLGAASGTVRRFD